MSDRMSKHPSSFSTLWTDVFGRPVLWALVQISIILAGYLNGQAATLPTGFSETQIASGLSAPTAMAFAPDGRLFVCEQTGRLRVIKNGSLLTAPFVQLTVDSNGERGLLGVTFDPNFATNQFVYVYYTATTPAVHNRVSRFTADGDVAAAGETIILELNNLSGATNHNGGALHFGPDGKLYVAVGENANMANSQTLTNLLGKVLRLNADGSIPTDNPFFNTATGINRIIWALGLRNPYTFDFQPGSGMMFINDVGAGSAEEVNLGQAGANYGWPTCEGSCSNPNFANPIFSYGHGTGATTGCAIVGGAFYNPSSNQFPSTYTGSFFFADLCSGWIRRLDTMQGNAVSSFATGLSQPVDLKVAPDGTLYYLQRGGGGQVFRIRFVWASQFDFNQSSYGASESGGAVTITINRTGDLSTTAAVDYTTSNGTATDTSDYTTNLGRLTFNPGETSKAFVILLTDDLYDENDENVTLTLTNAIAASIGSQATSQLMISDNDGGAPTTNPADQVNFFVRQHYLDFLNREADSGGLGYWSNQIDICASDPQCIHSRRVGVSAAFFIETEFQETGFFVVRMYRAGLGRRPSLAEFVRDRTRLVVGTNLETEKLAYALDFVQRPEFSGRFPLAQGASAFVDALIEAVRTADLDLGNRRAELLTEYNSGSNQSDSRARTLRRLIDFDEYRAAEFNGAFVLAQYFGYLRRNPEEGGYQFWLDVLNNRVPNNYRSMVCAFITSGEYQQRFSSVITRSNQDCAQQ
jgi:glucose/arabinose dehydrogenase